MRHMRGLSCKSGLPRHHNASCHHGYGVSGLALSSRACANYVISTHIATRRQDLANVAKGSLGLSLGSKNTFNPLPAKLIIYMLPFPVIEGVKAQLHRTTLRVRLLLLRPSLISVSPHSWCQGRPEVENGLTSCHFFL